MRTIAEFIKTTLIGGLLIVLPVYIAVLLILKAAQGLVTAVKPITALIPTSVEYDEILAILVLAAICFIAGLIVRTRSGIRAKNVIERRVLQRLPGYTLLRGLTGRVMGQADDPAFAPALVDMEDGALVPALIVEKLYNGHYAVLVPSVPTPMAGAVYIFPPERVHPVDVPFTAALKVFTKWGAGTGEFVQAMEASKKPTPLRPVQVSDQ
jgi:uncharacterized membrane protein